MSDAKQTFEIKTASHKATVVRLSEAWISYAYNGYYDGPHTEKKFSKFTSKTSIIVILNVKAIEIDGEKYDDCSNEHNAALDEMQDEYFKQIGCKIGGGTLISGAGGGPGNFWVVSSDVPFDDTDIDYDGVPAYSSDPYRSDYVTMRRILDF